MLSHPGGRPEVSRRPGPTLPAVPRTGPSKGCERPGPPVVFSVLPADRWCSPESSPGLPLSPTGPLWPKLSQFGPPSGSGRLQGTRSLEVGHAAPQDLGVVHGRRSTTRKIGIPSESRPARLLHRRRRRLIDAACRFSASIGSHQAVAHGNQGGLDPRHGPGTDWQGVFSGRGGEGRGAGRDQRTSRIGWKLSSRDIGRPLRSGTVASGPMPRLW